MRRLLQLFCGVALLCLAGCGYLQGLEGDRMPGPRGQIFYKTCPATGRNYWVYLPEHYDKDRSYPLVVSLHGMKPYDVARYHVEMWNRFADQHLFIILAPELRSSDSLGQFPLRSFGAVELADVQHVLACMDEVVKDRNADPKAIMLSSWNMGGYLAHYIAAAEGDRFAAFAPLQSNFSGTVLDPAKARQWVSHMQIMVFYGTITLPVVTNESKAAVGWWTQVGYNVTVKTADVGNERHPELAAEFFEKVLAANAAAKTPTSRPDSR